MKFATAILLLTASNSVVAETNSSIRKRDLEAKINAKMEARAEGKSGKASKTSKSSKASKSSSSSSDDTCAATTKPVAGANPCAGAKIEIPNEDCFVDGEIVVNVQSGTDVTYGYAGNLETDGVMPFTDPYFMSTMCPVNVHWHLGAEHRSEGQYDEDGVGPDERRLAEGARLGLRCHHYDAEDPKFTEEYDWKYCVDMHVGETYEVHWPHSAAGDCGTVNQFQTPFYDGVFCNAERLDLTKLPEQVGVQGQVFTIVNDEDYYWPDMMRGMIVDADLEMGVEITKYTGSTTGTSRDNEVCSGYTPITWQVDRTCHMVSASSFDKMCADMLSQRDDMSDDLYAHGARELVISDLAADNHVWDRKTEEKTDKRVFRMVYD